MLVIVSEGNSKLFFRMEPFGKRRAQPFHPIECANNPSFQPSHRLDILANTSSDHSIRLNILTNAAPDYPILLNMPTTHPPNHPIRFGVLEMDEKLPHRGYTFDSRGC